MTVRVKICGITGRDDAHAALACGADYIGIIVDVAGSRRSVPVPQAAGISAGISSAVILMEGPVKAIATAMRRIKPHAVQLISAITPAEIAGLRGIGDIKIWKTVRVRPHEQGSSEALTQHLADLQQAGIDAIVLDTMVPGHKGGTGQTCDWNIAARIVQTIELPVFLAGGLTPENVALAIAGVRPFGVDVSSGVEISPGQKSREKVSYFIRQASAA